MRAFVDKELMPHAHDWEENKKIPPEVFVKAFEAGW